MFTNDKKHICKDSCSEFSYGTNTYSYYDDDVKYMIMNFRIPYNKINPPI